MEQVISSSAGFAGRQRGVALVMVLIMLAAMAIAGVALVRVVDSANVISGNFAFRQVTLNIADLGVEAAVAKLAEMREKKKTDPTVDEKPYPSGCSSSCVYFPARSDNTMVNGQGLPTKGSVDGTNTQDVSWNGSDVDVVAAGGPSGYSIRYVIDRQCTLAPVTDAVGQCLTDTPQGGGSKKSGATLFTPASSIYYRVSIQVTGPRKTQSHVQVVLGY